MAGGGQRPAPVARKHWAVSIADRACKRCEANPHLKQRPHYVHPWMSGSDLTRFADRQPDGITWDWWWTICPACLHVARVPRCVKEDACEPVARCTAPPSAELDVLRTRLVKVLGSDKRQHMQCGVAVWLNDLSPGLAKTLETALRIGGTPAVLTLLERLGPVEFGLDDPGGAPHDWELAKSRPKSIKRKYKRRKPRAKVKR